MHYACTYCGSRPSKDHLQGVYDKCCAGKPEGMACKPDNDTRCCLEKIVKPWPQTLSPKVPNSKPRGLGLTLNCSRPPAPSTSTHHHHHPPPNF